MGKLRKWLRSLFCVCMALGMLVVSSGPYARAVNIEDLQDEYDRLDQQIEANRNKLNELASDMEDQQAYIDTLNDQIETTQQQAEVLQERIAMLNADISSLNNKIEALDTKIQQTQAEAEEQEGQIEETFELLKERLRAMYMAGGGSQLEFLLEAGDFETFLIRTELLRSVTRHDTQLIDALSEELEVFQGLLQTMEEDKASLQEQQETLVARKADVQASAQQLSEKEDEINANVKQANSYIQQLDHNSDLYQAQMRKLQADRDEVDAPIRICSGRCPASTTSPLILGRVILPVSPIIGELISAAAVCMGMILLRQKAALCFWPRRINPGASISSSTMATGCSRATRIVAAYSFHRATG